MNKLFKNPKIGEVARFLIAGGICFLVQSGLLWALHDKAGLDTLAAMPIAFFISVVVNYILSVLWIWPSSGEGDAFTKFVTRLGFLVTSGIGLLLNELFMWIFGLLFGEEQVLFSLGMAGKTFDVKMYLINTCITTVLVMFWNFFTKRAVLQSPLIRKWAAGLARKKDS